MKNQDKNGIEKHINFKRLLKKLKNTTYKYLWISKQGTRNFYIMYNQDYVLID
jgi:hypothetical protein